MISAGAHGRGDMHANNALHSNACLDSGCCRFATSFLRYRTRSGDCCIGKMSVVEAQKQRGKQAKARARAKKAPRSEVRRYNVLMAKIHNPQIHLLLPHQHRPSQASRTIQCITIPCRGRLESIVMADTLMDPTRSRPGKPSSTSSSVPVRLLQVARQSNLMGDYYCQPAYLAILHHPSCSLPYPERC
jgi:hypothetical protein